MLNIEYNKNTSKEAITLKIVLQYCQRYVLPVIFGKLKQKHFELFMHKYIIRCDHKKIYNFTNITIKTSFIEKHKHLK